MSDKSVPLASLDHIANGALAERFAHALNEVAANIRDLNTPATKARKIAINITLTPEDDREYVTFGFDVRPTLVPRRTVKTEILLGANEEGDILVREITKQIPGQISMTGEETTPRIAKIVNIK